MKNRIKQGQHLLKMIEDVDPEDTDTLDEIDARFCEFVYHGELCDLGIEVLSERGRIYQVQKYTRDLQSLHDVMPDGWYITKCFMLKDYYVFGLSHDFELNGKPFTNTELSHPLKTMHLAWMHALIQAYIYMEGCDE